MNKLSVAFLCCVMFGRAAGSTYNSNKDEIEVFATVLQAEISANHWNQADAMCITVSDQFPSKKLLQALSSYNLTVRNQADWPRKTSCSFAVHLQPAEFVAGTAQVKLVSDDLRGINSGVEHVATHVHQGMYQLKRTGRLWKVYTFMLPVNPND